MIGASRGTAAVTGGIKIGTTNGGTEVIAAQPVPAVGAAGSIFDTPVVANALSLAAQTIYVQAVTAWAAGSVVDLAVEYIETNTQY